MLPDYPEVKARITKAMQDRMEARRNARLHPFSKARKTTWHEGRKTRFLNRDEDDSMMEAIPFEASAALNEEIKTIEDLTVDHIFGLLDELTDKLAVEQFKHFKKMLDDGVEKVGNVVRNAKSDIDAFFEMMKKVHVDFDENGNPCHFDMLVFSPEKASDLRAMQETIMSTPALRQRYTDLMDQKKREWRDREADRYLAE